MKILYFIPARGGSKGILQKNIKELAGKPLIQYSIEIAKAMTTNFEDICVSTDDLLIKNMAQKLGLFVPFLRPVEISGDSASTNDAIIHALNYYSQKGIEYEVVVVLQPTSPLRALDDVKGAISIFNNQIDMVVSVKVTDSNPYYVLFEEDEKGLLYKCKEGGFVSRQSCPTVYEYNGAVYIINVNSLKAKPIIEFNKIVKFLMPSERSIDIDNLIDWELCEILIKNNKS
jgi:CMP-N,N'-diacetyllegionaminic acid synthase